MDGMSWILDINNNNPNRPRCEDVYEMEEIIGSGTFSDVVRGVHNQEGKKYAIKIIDKSKVNTTKQRWRIQNEVALHLRSSHPNIVTLHDYYESDLDVCLVMELCEGGELFNKIVEKGFFNEQEACRVVKQLVSAIQYLHSLGVVHRDIKPENILFTGQGEDSEIKLADFGLAKMLETPSPGRAMLKASTSGTTAYCAPERLKLAQESKAVDMWSVGCILYFLLYGIPPFYSTKEDDEENDDEIVQSVMDGAINFSKRQVSDMAKDLILRLLEKEPSRRINAEQVLLHPWIKSFGTVGTVWDDLSSGSQSGNRAAILKSSINKVIDVCALKSDSLGFDHRDSL